MAFRFALALATIVFSGIPLGTPLFAQFGSPYPGMGGGGIGFPGGGVGLPGQGRRQNRTNGPTDTLNGKIKRISTAQMVLTTDDGRDITIALDRGTRYLTSSGSNGKYGDFDNGDQISVDAALDNQNYYHGVRVTMVQKYSPSDSNSTSSNSSSNSSTPKDDDPDRPVLKRAGGSSSNGSSSSNNDSASNNTASDNTGSGNTGTNRTAPRPQIVSGDPTMGDSQSSATIAPRPIPREADDPGPPVLRRNAAARVDNTPPAGSDASEAVTPRPSLRAQDANGVTRMPPPPVVGPSEIARNGNSSETIGGRAPQPIQRPGDQTIWSARDAAFEFTDTLPNYVVKQYTTRYQTDVARGNRTSWQALDIVTADVVCEGGKESYKNILVNGKPPHDAIEKTGSWSTGEFATVLQGILAPQTAADFHNKRSTNIVNRPAWVYDFAVDQPRSMWHVTASSESVVAAYTGTIWIDKENFRVLRIEMQAVDMPRSFALDDVESAVDYDYVMIGGEKYLLPVHSEALSCVRGTAECTRNVIEFRNYKKFGADTSITFGPDVEKP
jgi:hypothetical protein